MKIMLQTKLHMAGSCFKVAYDPEFRPVWENQTPLRFGQELERLRVVYAVLNGQAARARVAGPGASDAKLAVENELCGLTHATAQALTFHCKKVGDVERAAQVDLSRSQIQHTSMQKRVDTAAAVLNLASATVDSPGASDCGLTHESLDRLKNSLERYQDVMLLPRQQIVNRSSTLKDLEEEVAGLIEDLRGLDGLILQFAETEPGRHFVHAWQRARVIVNAATHPLPTEPANPPSPPVPVLPRAA